MTEYAFEPIETISDLVAILKLKEYRDNGCPFELLKRLDLPFPEAAVIELRRRGYEIERGGEGDGRWMKLRALPGASAKRRKRAQLNLLGDAK